MKRADFSEIIRVGIVILILLFLLGILFLLRIKSSQRLFQIQNGVGGRLMDATETMFFLPEKKSVKEGEEFELTILFQADKKIINGADAVIFYDPEAFEITNIQASAQTGEYFKSYLKKKVDKDKKIIKITGYQPKESGALSGEKRFATLKLKAKKKGFYTLSFDFAAGTTNRSTLVEKETGKNLLKKVIGAEIEVK